MQRCGHKQAVDQDDVLKHRIIPLRADLKIAILRGPSDDGVFGGILSGHAVGTVRYSVAAQNPTGRPEEHKTFESISTAHGSGLVDHARMGHPQE